MSAGGHHVPDLILEQFRLHELPAGEGDRIRRLVQTDPTLRARLDALERSDDDIAAQYPAQWLAERVRARLTTPRPASGGLRRLALGSAFAAAVALIVSALPLIQTDGERVKGLSPAMAIYRRTPQGSETLADGAMARAGDLLRIGYVSAGRSHGVILSIDGRGVVTQHLPAHGTAAAALRNSGVVLLDDAYELDDAPAWERFYFITADHPFDVGPITDAARRAAARGLRAPPRWLSVPRELTQSAFSIQKEVQP
jgi:hypothetical protein